MKQAIITTLGMIGKDKDGKFKTADYKFDKSIVDTDSTLEYVNIFPLLVGMLENKYDIIPLYTTESLQRQKEVLEYHEKVFDIETNGKLIDENDPKQIFQTINTITSGEKYSHFIIDVTHGFRSIPILTTVNMIITNFQDNQKIKHIIYAQEDFENKGNYLIKDLIEYLDIANIAFVLTAFEKNYTVSNHIKSDKYENLLKALDDFSNDIMALSLNNLFDASSKNLIKELENITDVSISKQAQNLKEMIEKLTPKEGKKRHQTYFDLSKDLFEKNYMFLSLALLFESIRMYIKTTIKKEHKDLVERVEQSFKNDLYKIGDFFKNLSWKKYENYIDPRTNKQILQITQKEYTALKNEFDKLNILDLYKKIDKKRNNLAHANSQGSFADIKNDIANFIQEYGAFISPKTPNDLLNKFNNR